MYFINNFFFYSIIGHIFESIIYLFCEGESGILYGPWTPVYGIGVVIIFSFYIYFIKKGFSKKIIIWNLFLVGFILLTLIECIGGYLLELIFGTVFWNYDSLPLHIGNYISLEISFIWGILSIICVIFFKPLSDKIIKKIPICVTWIFIILFFIDILITLYLKSDLFVFFKKLF